MTEDATLSSFQDSEDDADASEERADTSEERADTSDEQANTGEEHANTGEKPTNADAEPAISTYVWGTYTCDDCGETVPRAWREDDEFVCPSCKEW